MSLNKILPVKPAAQTPQAAQPVNRATAAAPAKPVHKRRKPARRRPIGG